MRVRARRVGRDRQNGPGPAGTGTGTGTKFSFSPGPGPGLNFFFYRDRDLFVFQLVPVCFFFIKYWTIYFLIFYLFFLVRIYKSPIFIYDPDRSRLLTSVLIAKLRIIDNYLEGRVVWV